MNWQDISDFIELVKNPKKAEDLLAQFKSQKEQLDAAIETVGKASEISKLQAKAAKTLETAQSKAEQIEADAVAAAAKQQEAVNAEAEKVRANQEKVNKDAQEALTRLEQAKEIEASFSRREKDLRAKEEAASKEADRLAQLISEYEAKVLKLRSAMGE